MEIYSDLIESLENCVASCNNCAASCLREENVKALAICIKLNLDCADACHLAFKLLARDSNHAVSVVELCKNLCRECAEECEKHDHDHCQLCAKACTKCANQSKNYIDQVVQPA